MLKYFFRNGIKNILMQIKTIYLDYINELNYFIHNQLLKIQKYLLEIY